VLQAVATGIALGDQMEPQMQQDRNGEYPWLDASGLPVPPPGATSAFDVTKPNLKFFEHVDEILDVAAEHEFYVRTRLKHHAAAPT
jgi:hypothetical protein